MNRSAVVLFTVLAALALPAAAQNTLEIIALRHRTAEQVIPLLQGLMEPGGTLSGQGTQLFVRTSPANLSDIQLALGSIDRPLKRLMISVRLDESSDAASRELGASGRIGIGNRSGGPNVEIRAQDSRARGEERVDQRVQTIEGGRAMIMTGASRPVRQRQLIQTPAGVVSQEVTVVQEQASGFEVIPRLAGNVVQVEIAQQHMGQRAASAVSGRLGEWFELGAVAVNATRDASGIASGAQSSGRETRRVWIRVDEIP